MAMACFRLVTFPPLPPFPERKVPRFSRRSAAPTARLAAFPYFLGPLFAGMVFLRPLEARLEAGVVSRYGFSMRPIVLKQDLTKEFSTPERCFIFESLNATHDCLSVARARVEPGVTTKWHRVEGTVERYIIAEGQGRVEVGDLPPAEVGPGDVALIPAGVRQRIANLGLTDLIFYCVCTPPFAQERYQELE